MTRKQALTDLLEKVEAGNIPDTGIDRFSAIPRRSGGVYGDSNWYDANAAYWSGSLDAAQKLHKSVLPGWLWTNGAVPETPYGQGNSRLCFVWPNNHKHYLCEFRPEGKNQDPARAWLIAILKALIATEAPPHDAQEAME